MIWVILMLWCTHDRALGANAMVDELAAYLRNKYIDGSLHQRLFSVK